LLVFYFHTIAWQYFYALPELCFLVVLLLAKSCFAFNAITTILPVYVSNSFMATLATLPPCFATFLLSSKFFGFTACEISLVNA
jgi:hypothetical protein